MFKIQIDKTVYFGAFVSNYVRLFHQKRNTTQFET